jgi:hypothetical protein
MLAVTSLMIVQKTRVTRIFLPSFFHGLKLGYFKSEKKHYRRRKELKKKEYEKNG